MTPILVKPSLWLEKGIQIENVNSVNLFKFTDELQARMQELVDKKTADSLTPEEAAEMEAIGELIVIVTYMNGMIANEVQNSQETETWEQRLEKN
ncbi:hypothetical protein I8748_19090 [Nostoc sp. CENA67]|uniref:Uncharacterized protein n=1 Tax=Amazonocrinis nigriterrae CENA67 TaxID=2794033 RepID=A0A8J7HRC2_9NOST|nr:hypothetical protein [Amazonocrinis nigriterrae]MBH8564267.1 hypothetical protein [Amazonocrinis nigriterrae CENA67]